VKPSKEVQAMGLTWKDGVSTLFMGAIAAIYLTFLHGTGLWLISSARGTTAAVFILGMVGGCMLSGAGQLYQEQRSAAVRAWLVIASCCGVVAFAAALAGLVTGNTVALAILVAATGALWFAATLRHALMVPPGPARSRDTHEVIHHEAAGPR
jgi:hypothetical protein